MAEVHWGVDGRTHRIGPNGQTLCKTMIDYSREPEQRAFSGCQVCDIVRHDLDAPDSQATTRALVISIVIVIVIGLLFFAALT
jgi:hypothetical protein